jgi:hypothetical protein
MSIDFFPTCLLALAGGPWEAVDLCLLAHVLEEPAPALPNAVTIESTLGAWAEIGISWIRVSCSPLNPGMCEIKLSKACDEK